MQRTPTLKSFSWVALGLAVSFGLASTALADPGRGNPRYDRHARQASDVDRLAKKVVYAADGLYEDAARNIHRRGWRERRVLESLRCLSVQSVRFDKQLARYGPDRLQTRREFHELVAAWHDVARARTALHASRHVDRRLDRFNRLIDELRFAYQAQMAYNRPFPDRRDSRYGVRVGSRNGNLRIGGWWFGD